MYRLPPGSTRHDPPFHSTSIFRSVPPSRLRERIARQHMAIGGDATGDQYHRQPFVADEFIAQLQVAASGMAQDQGAGKSAAARGDDGRQGGVEDRKSKRLNSSH